MLQCLFYSFEFVRDSTLRAFTHLYYTLYELSKVKAIMYTALDCADKNSNLHLMSSDPDIHVRLIVLVIGVHNSRHDVVEVV